MTLLFTRTDIETIIERGGSEFLEDLTARIEAGYREMASGLVEQHQRIYLRSNDDPQRRPKGLYSMSAVLRGAALMGTRLLALGGPGADGLLVLFDHQTLKCLAIMYDQGALQKHRSGTPAGLATRHLARTDARVIAVIGSSGTALGGLVIAKHARSSVEWVKVFSPTTANYERFAGEMTRILGKEVKAVSSAEEAAEDADIFVVATDADRPVVPDNMIAPGTHLNLMARNEVEMNTFKRASW